MNDERSRHFSQDDSDLVSNLKDSTCVFWKTDRQRRLLDLLSEQILLVEEEDDGGVYEELVVTDGVKEHERLVHAVLQEEEIYHWGQCYSEKRAGECGFTTKHHSNNSTYQ